MIRRLTESDRPQFQVWASRFQPRPDFNWTPQDLLESLKKDIVWGAWQGLELVSAVACSRSDDPVEILWLATHPDRQGQGFMTQLLKSLLQDAVRCERKVLLEVHEKNQGALSLYHRLGFVGVGVRKNYYQDGAASLLFTYFPSTKAPS
ncbi:MAG: GNAT family N-acetyltransferase [Bdellovibrionales bacterium]